MDAKSQARLSTMEHPRAFWLRQMSCWLFSQNNEALQLYGAPPSLLSKATVHGSLWWLIYFQICRSDCYLLRLRAYLQACFCHLSVTSAYEFWEHFSQLGLLFVCTISAPRWIFFMCLARCSHTWHKSKNPLTQAHYPVYYTHFPATRS